METSESPMRTPIEKRRSKLLVIVLLAAATYVVALLFRLFAADAPSLMVYALSPVRSFAAHAIPPAPNSAELVAWRLRMLSQPDRENLIQHPLVSIHVLFGLRDSANNPVHALSDAKIVSDALIEIGLPVGKRNSYGCNSLQVAARLGDRELKAFMLELGADLDEPGWAQATDPQCRRTARELDSRRLLKGQ